MTTDDDGPAGRTDPRWRPSPTKLVVAVILLVGIVAPLLVGSYARIEPRLFGFPFFFWYQLLWVFLAAGCCAISYLLLRAEQRRFAARQDGARPSASRRRDGAA